MSRYIQVTVPYYIPIAVLGMIVGAVLTLGTVPDFLVLYAAISLTFLVAGFNTLNGVYDINIDRINKPYRPIPNGKISKRAGITYAILLYFLSFLSALPTNNYFLTIWAISVILTIFYSIPTPRLRAKYVVNTLTGLVFYGLLCPLSGWALYPTFPVPTALIIFIFIIGSGIAITKDFEDIHGDKAFQIKTIPIALGRQKASTLVTTLILLSFIYLAAIAIIGAIELRYLAILIFIPWALYTVHLISSEHGNNNRRFFIKNILLAISIELFIIVVTLI